MLTFALNVTLDGCCDHREGIADDELLEHYAQLLAGAGAMLYGRVTYELMEAFWPTAEGSFARAMNAIPKYVVSSTRKDFPWTNSFHIGIDEVKKLVDTTHVIVGSPMLATELEKRGMIDEYRVVIHPVIAGHGPRLFEGASRKLELVEMKRFPAGQIAVHYLVKR